MTDKVLERILGLIAKGYEVRIRPAIMSNCIEIRLTRANHTVAQIMDPMAASQSYAFESDEEWFMYNLTWLEMKYETYAKRYQEGQE